MSIPTRSDAFVRRSSPASRPAAGMDVLIAAAWLMAAVIAFVGSSSIG